MSFIGSKVTHFLLNNLGFCKQIVFLWLIIMISYKKFHFEASISYVKGIVGSNWRLH